MILPFRAELEEVKYTAKFPGDDSDTHIKIFYLEKFHLGIELGQEVRVFVGEVKVTKPRKNVLDTSICTLFEVTTQIQSELEREEFRKWINSQSLKIISDDLIPKINHLIDWIKFEKPDVHYTGVFRRIGTIDLLYVNLLFEEKIIHSRVNSTFLTGLEFNIEPYMVNLNLSKELPREWLILSRAVDLVNHGFELEGFIVAFSLLDDFTTKYISENLPNLQQSEARKLLRKIEEERLITYLGTFFRIIHGCSPIDETADQEDLKWLNEKRNKMLHQGVVCSREDAIKGLNIVFNILLKINEKNGGFILPKKLEFWTPNIS